MWTPTRSTARIDLRAFTLPKGPNVPILLNFSTQMPFGGQRSIQLSYGCREPGGT